MAAEPAMVDVTGYQIFALASLISAVVAGVVAWYQMRNAAKKDSLSLAYSQIANLTKDLQDIRDRYNALWDQFQKERERYEKRIDEILKLLEEIKAEKLVLQQKIDELQRKIDELNIIILKFSK